MTSIIRMFAAAACASAMTIAATSFAAPAGDVSSRAGNTPLPTDATYKAFHEKAGIDRIAADFVARISTDPRIEKYFQGVDLKHLSAELADQFCYLLDGPCTYTGRDMRSVHQAMGLNKDDFNALAEDLQDAMDNENIGYASQNRLVAKLAPMMHIIVTK